MRIQLLAAALAMAVAVPAYAADAVVDEVVVVDSAYNWSGVYVGGLLGYGWGDTHFDDGAISNPFDIDGVTGGATVGYNYQFNQNWVFGVEGDISWSGIDGGFGPNYGDSNNLGQPDGSSWGCGGTACETEIEWYGTARARLGYAFDNVLLYGTGGLAFGRVQSQIVDNPAYYISDTNVGWAAGAGVEYGFTQNWTAKLEYMHVDLGWTDRNDAEDFRSDAELDAVRFGVNYKF